MQYALFIQMLFVHLTQHIKYRNYENIKHYYRNLFSYFSIGNRFWRYERIDYDKTTNTKNLNR